MSRCIGEPMSLIDSRSSLKTLTPDKFFSDYVFSLKLTFFGTRFEKMGMSGDKMESRSHHVLAAFFGS
jgi:hypothetical protein